jgi:hypothetical protein
MSVCVESVVCRDHSSRGVLASVRCLSEIVKPQQSGGPGALGALAPRKKLNILCVYGFRYPVCKAHAPYCIVICGLSGYTIFSHIISQTARFEEEVTEHKICILISAQSWCLMLLTLLRIQRHITINIYWSSGKVPVIIARF